MGNRVIKFQITGLERWIQTLVAKDPELTSGTHVVVCSHNSSLGNLMLSSDFSRLQACIWVCRHTCRKKEQLEVQSGVGCIHL